MTVSSVSLQSEEFHIYTQYCTNYPRYALRMCRSTLFSSLLFQVRPLCVGVGRFVPGIVLNAAEKMQSLLRMNDGGWGVGADIDPFGLWDSQQSQQWKN